MNIKEGHVIEKLNTLNEIRSCGMSLQELRFFSIYLAKINARDISTRVVRFGLRDFQRIMEFGKLNLAQLRDTVDSLLCKIVGIPLKSGGFDRFQLFKKCRVDKDEDGEWYVEINAHDDALPLLFDFKEQYFTYQLWNALKLKSSNQLRMYEILKQYEGIGERVISIDDLKLLLGLSNSEYPRFNTFRESVIDVCQKALEENTDIKFTYAPAKRGAKGKIHSLKFTITKNADYISQLSLDDFINGQAAQGFISGGEIAVSSAKEKTELADEYFTREIYPLLSEVCNDEFTPAEIQLLHDILVKVIPYTADGGSRKRLLDMHDFLKLKYNELSWRASRTKIKNRFAYLKKIVEAELKLMAAEV